MLENFQYQVKMVTFETAGIYTVKPDNRCEHQRICFYAVDPSLSQRFAVENTGSNTYTNFEIDLKKEKKPYCP